MRRITDDAPFVGTEAGARGAARRTTLHVSHVGLPPKKVPRAAERAADAMPATRRRSHLTAVLRRERQRREDTATPALSTHHPHRGAVASHEERAAPRRSSCSRAVRTESRNTSGRGCAVVSRRSRQYPV